MTSDINDTFCSNKSCLSLDLCVGELTLLPADIRSTLFVIVAAATAVIGTTGNTLVLVCFCLEKKLRTAANSLLGHLALVDLMNCIITIPLYLVMVSTRNSIRSCWIWLMTIPFLTVMSVYIQGLIGINRFFLVTKNMADFRQCFGLRRSSTYVTLGWVITAVFIGLLLTLMDPPEHDGLHSCSSYSNLNATRKLTTAMILGFSGMYFAVAVVFYIRLARFVHNYVMGITAKKRSDVRTSKILLVLGVFSMVSLCLSPAVLVISHSLNIDRNLTLVFREIAVVVYFVSYCVNPIFFFTKVQLFKTTLERMLPPRNRIAPNPSSERDAFGKNSQQAASSTRRVSQL